MHEEQLCPQLRFAAFVEQPDEWLDLAEGALLIADVSAPDLDHHRVLQRLDVLAEAVREELGLVPGETLLAPQVAQRETAERTLGAMRLVLACREGLQGDEDDYYDPRNSFLNDVLDRRVGLPITLSIIYIDIARRIGAPLVGVGLPAHFIAKWPLSADEGDDLFLDAFHGGELLDLDACRELMLRLTANRSGGPLFDPLWIEPVGTRAILTRMLYNLKHIYLQRGNTAAALEVVDRLVLLRPDLSQELRDRGLLRLAVGETLLAAADLAAYAERAPTAPEVRRLRKRLAAIGEIHNKLN